MDFNTLLTCLLAVTLLTLTPGIDTLLVVRNSARGGWYDGAVSSFGICSGLFVHALVSACGISIILLQTAWAYNGLKIVGAAYLLWLGLTSWRRLLLKKANTMFTGPAVAALEFNSIRSFREGFLSNVLNPKTVIFYMAFLPQFIDPNKGALWQSLTVAVIHFAVAMTWQCLLASMVGRAKSWLEDPRYSRTFDGLTGSMMIFIGIRLVFTD